MSRNYILLKLVLYANVYAPSFSIFVTPSLKSKQPRASSSGGGGGDSNETKLLLQATELLDAVPAVLNMKRLKEVSEIKT